MINESPDVVGGEDNLDGGDPYAPNALDGNRSPTYGDSDSITFALFSNFIIYGDPDTTHGDLYDYLSSGILYGEPFEFLKKQFNIKHFGELLEDEKNKIKDISQKTRIDRTPVLRDLPYVLQGRLWTISKIISFWNDLVYIASRKKDIIEFIRLIGGNPNQYQYEIKDKLYSYEDFSSGRYSDNLKFDPGVVHTLSPEKKGDALRQMGVQPKKPVPLQFKQMIQGESFIENSEIAYQGRRRPFQGVNYNLNLLAKYEPANLGLFFTNSKEMAASFSGGKYVDMVNINTDNFAKKDAGGENLRYFLPWVKKAKIHGKSGVLLTNVIDGKKHDKLFIVFDPLSIIDRKEITQGEGFRSWLKLVENWKNFN